MTNLKNVSKRGLALFVVLVMCLSMMNLTVFADSEDSSDQGYVQVDESTTFENTDATGEVEDTNNGVEDGETNNEAEGDETNNEAEDGEIKDKVEGDGTNNEVEDGETKDKVEDIDAKEDKPIKDVTSEIIQGVVPNLTDALCTCTDKCGEEGNSDCPVCAENPGACTVEEPEEELTISFNSETGTLTINNAANLTKDIVTDYLREASIKQTDVLAFELNNVGDIAGYAFYGWNNLKTLTFNNAASIGDHAFFKCENLATVTLKDVETIGPNAFAESKQLGSLSMENIGTVCAEAFRQCSALTNPSMKNVGAFERSPFSYCTGLTTLTLDGEDGIKGLGTTMFYGCTGLTEVTLKNMDTVAIQVFNGCTALKSVTIENVRTLESQLFYGCTALEDVTLDGVETIGENAFLSCAGLKTVTMDNIGTIGKNAFASCKALETVAMGTVNTIGQYAFYNCTALKTVKMDKVNRIDQYAFWSCSSLETIDSLSNVNESIGGFAFYGCSSLKGLSVADLTKMGYNGSVEMMDRIQAILAGKFQLDNAETIRELSLDSGWDVGEVGQSANWNEYDNGTQLMEQARWQNVTTGVAEVKVDAYYTAKKQMDYIFVADLSASMAQLGNQNDRNARFYDMQSKLLDMTSQLLDAEGYDCQVAIVTFGGLFKENATQKSSGFLTSAGDAEAYIKGLEPLNENTDYGLGLQEALELVKSNPNRNTVVVFLSDGAPNASSSGDMDGTEAAAAIKALNVPIYGVLHSPTAAQHDKALKVMEMVCNEVYESTDTESFGKAMNTAFTAAYGEHTVTIPVNAEDFDVSRLTTIAGKVEYRDGTITWTINGMPFTQHTLTYAMSLKEDRVSAIGTHEYALNNGAAQFGDNGASVNLSMTLSRTVNAPVVTNTLTINYLYANGDQAAEPVVLEVVVGDEYSVASPVIAGFAANIAAVSGRMGTEPVTVSVTYTAVGSSGSDGSDDSSTPGTSTPEDTNIPEEDVPLSNLPDNEEIIPEENVPLAEGPEQEETRNEEEILDEDVPLVNIPKTGDGSGLWYAMAMLSACGLAVLNLLKKREQ